MILECIKTLVEWKESMSTRSGVTYSLSDRLEAVVVTEVGAMEAQGRVPERQQFLEAVGAQERETERQQQSFERQSSQEFGDNRKEADPRSRGSSPKRGGDVADDEFFVGREAATGGRAV